MPPHSNRLPHIRLCSARGSDVFESCWVPLSVSREVGLGFAQVPCCRHSRVPGLSPPARAAQAAGRVRSRPRGRRRGVAASARRSSDGFRGWPASPRVLPTPSHTPRVLTWLLRPPQTGPGVRFGARVPCSPPGSQEPQSLASGPGHVYKGLTSGGDTAFLKSLFLDLGIGLSCLHGRASLRGVLPCPGLVSSAGSGPVRESRVVCSAFSPTASCGRERANPVPPPHLL